MKHEEFALEVIALAQNDQVIHAGFDNLNQSILSNCGKLWGFVITGEDLKAKETIGKISASVVIGEYIGNQLFDEYEPLPEPFCNYSGQGKELVADLIRQCIDNDYLLAHSTIKKLCVGCNFNFMECCELALNELKEGVSSGQK